jgi:hypothetical protein
LENENFAQRFSSVKRGHQPGLSVFCHGSNKEAEEQRARENNTLPRPRMQKEVVQVGVQSIYTEEGVYASSMEKSNQNVKRGIFECFNPHASQVSVFYQ